MGKKGHKSEKFERRVFDKLLAYLEYDDAIIFENPVFKYANPYKETSSGGKPIIIRMVNGGKTQYEVDRIAFARNQSSTDYDVIYSSIKNRAFEDLIPDDVNSAKLLGLGNVWNRTFLEQMNNVDMTRKTPGEFEHFKRSRFYKKAEEMG